MILRTIENRGILFFFLFVCLPDTDLARLLQLNLEYSETRLMIYSAELLTASSGRAVLTAAPQLAKIRLADVDESMRRNMGRGRVEKPVTIDQKKMGGKIDLGLLFLLPNVLLRKKKITYRGSAAAIMSSALLCTAFLCQRFSEYSHSRSLSP